MTKGINQIGKVREYGIDDRIDYFLSKSYSYQETADVINKELGNDKSVTKDIIYRYNLGKYHYQITKKELKN